MSEKKQTEHYKEIWVNKFDEDSVNRFRHDIMAITTIDPNIPIPIYIDSYGGYVDSLIKMIDTIDSLTNPIITIVMGKAFSCGSILASCGDHRFCTPNSRIMIHEVSAGAFGTVNDINITAKETDRINKQIMTLLAKNCGYKDMKEIKQRMIELAGDNADLYLTAKQSVEFGIVDEVGVPKINAMMIYECVNPPPIPKQVRKQRAQQILNMVIVEKQPKKKGKK